MPLWKEDWLSWILIYLGAGVFLVLFDLPSWWVASLLLGVWIEAQVACLRVSAGYGSIPAAVAAAVLQLAFMLSAFGVTVRGWRIAGELGMEVAGCVALIGSVAATHAAQRKLNSPLLIYPLEALVVAFFSGVFWCARFGWAVHPLAQLCLVHSGILGFVLTRNSLVVVQRLADSCDGSHIKRAWQLRPRDLRGLAAVLAAARSPSALTGLGLLILEGLAAGLALAIAPS